MKNLLVFLTIAILFSLTGCKENSTESNSERINLLISGIWEISNETEVGEIGAQLKFYQDGKAQERLNATSNWYTDYLQWTMSDNGEELTMHGTDGPGTMDQMKILELTTGVFRGQITNSTSSDAIGKIVKMFKAVN